jgi:hypothetical protein
MGGKEYRMQKQLSKHFFVCRPPAPSYESVLRSVSTSEARALHFDRRNRNRQRHLFVKMLYQLSYTPQFAGVMLTG